MEDRLGLTQSLLERARAEGFALAGVCSAQAPVSLGVFADWTESGKHGTMNYLPRSMALRADPSTLLPGARSILAVGLPYQQPNPTTPGQPRIAAYALGRDYHKTIRAKLRRVVPVLIDAGHQVRICVDSAPVLEREYAQRAGLGWFGKNTCLIDSRTGSLFLIGLVLTTAELHASAPAIGGCGTCTACIDACPTGAIVQAGNVWQVDARRCVSYLTIEHKGEIDPDLRTGIGDWTFGCDVCQSVCPFNQPRGSQPQRARVTTEPDLLAVRQWPSLYELARIEPESWDEATRGSAVRRTGLAGIRRNAEICIENAQKRNQGM